VRRKLRYKLITVNNGFGTIYDTETDKLWKDPLTKQVLYSPVISSLEDKLAELNAV
jgi:hypothetical protein